MKGLFTHLPKRQVVEKFVGVLLIILVYAIFLSTRFSVGDSLLLTALTWSAFVIATPVADAGIILDLPLRLVAGIRMVYAEILVWTIAIGLNIFTLATNPGVYKETAITAILHQILTQPWPLWIIIAISAIGTFASVIFVDELLDATHHRELKLVHRHGWIVRITGYMALFALFYLVYRYFLSLFGIEI